MKNVLTFVVAVALVSACAQVTPDQKTVQALESVPESAPAGVVVQANAVDPTTLSGKLTIAASNPDLTAAQREQLANPQNQQMIQNIVQLAQGGSAKSREAAATNLLSSTSSSDTSLSSLLTLLQTVAPVIEAADPALAPFIEIAIAVLPLIIAIFGGA